MNTAVHIPDYELLRCIGAGNYGEVWLGRNIMGTYRAIKIIHRNRFPVVRPFDREFSGIKKYEPLSRTHPGLISILHIGQNQEAGYFYYVMEVGDDEVAGQEINPQNYNPKTLATELGRVGQLPVDECIRIGLSLSDALAHLHRNGLVHRDIKPSNIIFVNGAPKFADIGLVADISESATFVGTEGYVPPEGPGKPTADLYGLGKVLYQISMGRNLQDFPELPTNLGEPNVATRLKQLYQVILTACDLNPRKRFQSGTDMSAQLDRIRGGNGRAVRPVNTATSAPTTLSAPLHISILHQPGQQPDERIMQMLRDRLSENRCRVFVNPHATIGVAWAREVEANISRSDIVIALLSAQSAESEMIAYELELAVDAAHQNQGKPRLMIVRVQWNHTPPTSTARYLEGRSTFQWQSPQDDDNLFNDICRALNPDAEPAPVQERPPIEATGGAVPLTSKFYVVRPADLEFQAAIDRGDSIVLIKGARQMGKTSLLARGLDQVRRERGKVVTTDFQSFDLATLQSLEKFYLTLSQLLANQLDLAVYPEDVWNARRSPTTNFESYVQKHVLEKIPTSIVWGLDEVDRLFACTFSTEVFSLFRSWHNKRALEPDAPWSRLTLAIAYATEAHLFITDINQSPFNVGTRLALEDFTEEQVAELNRLHGEPLRDAAELTSFMELVGGHPYLVRRALNELTLKQIHVAELRAQADGEEGIFGDHLRRLLIALAKDPAHIEVARSILAGHSICSTDAFYRLRSAGIIVGASPKEIQFRCELYANYLRRHLARFFRAAKKYGHRKLLHYRWHAPA